MIKKLLSIFAVVTLISNANAQQIPNGDFEIWQANGGEQADGWGTYGEAGMTMGLPYSMLNTAFQETVNVHGGTYSMRLETTYFSFADMTLTGLALTGNAFFGGVAGIPYTDRPSTLSGFIDYQPTIDPNFGTDTAMIMCYFSKFNVDSNRSDIIGGTQILITQGTGGYVALNEPLVWGSFDDPDTMLFVGYSTARDSVDLGVGSKLYMDDLSLSDFTTGKKGTLFSGVDTKLGPNPAKSELTFWTSDKNIGGTVRFYDVTGRFAKEVSIESYHQTINVKDLHEGLYVYEVRNANGERVKSGKVNVIE